MNIFKFNYKFFPIITLMLAIIFLFFIFVSPGIEKGKDLIGGTTITVRGIPEQTNAELIKSSLEKNFNLKDLEVLKTGKGLIISYAQNKTLEQAKNNLGKAKELLNSNPEESKNYSKKVLEQIKNFYSDVPEEGLNAEELFAFTNKAFLNSKQALQLSLEKTILSTINSNEKISFTVDDVPPTFGSVFWESALKVALIGFVLVVISIFFFFREFIPSAAVIGAAAFDILGALGLMSVFKIPLGLSTITALLMLIGYSVDTDILLTDRVLKRHEKDARERAFDAMKTGLTMTLTTIAAITVMVVISYLNQINFIFEIAIVILFGLFADIISTWLMNAPILLYYTEKKGIK